MTTLRRAAPARGATALVDAVPGGEGRSRRARRAGRPARASSTQASRPSTFAPPAIAGMRSISAVPGRPCRVVSRAGRPQERAVQPGGEVLDRRGIGAPESGRRDRGAGIGSPALIPSGCSPPKNDRSYYTSNIRPIVRLVKDRGRPVPIVRLVKDRGRSVAINALHGPGHGAQRRRSWCSRVAIIAPGGGAPFR